MFQGWAYLAANGHGAGLASLAGIAAVASGITLLVGFLTPMAGAVLSLGEIGVALSWLPQIPAYRFEPGLMTCFVAVVAAAICPLGPGALSLDARLFGRREIIIPRSPRSPQA